MKNLIQLLFLLVLLLMASCKNSLFVEEYDKNTVKLTLINNYPSEYGDFVRAVINNEIYEIPVDSEAVLEIIPTFGFTYFIIDNEDPFFNDLEHFYFHGIESDSKVYFSSANSGYAYNSDSTWITHKSSRNDLETDESGLVSGTQRRTFESNIGQNTIGKFETVLEIDSYCINENKMRLTINFSELPIEYKNLRLKFEIRYKNTVCDNDSIEEHYIFDTICDGILTTYSTGWFNTHELSTKEYSVSVYQAAIEEIVFYKDNEQIENCIIDNGTLFD